MKKKVAVSTIAVSMAAATLAGVPLSNKGLANYLGTVSVSAAATTSNLDIVKAKLDKLYGELSSNDKAKLQALRTEVSTKITEEVFKSSFSGLLEKTTAAGVNSSTLFDIFHAVNSLVYDPSYQNLVDIRNNSTYINAAKKLGEAGGLDNLSVDDLSAFVFGTNGFEQTMVNIVKTKKLSELTALVNDADARNSLIKEAFKQSLNLSVHGHKLSDVLNKLGVTEDQLATAYTSVQSKLDPAIVKNATLALALAYIKAEGITLSPEGGGFIPGGASGGAAGGASGGAAVTPTPSQQGSLESLSLIDASKMVEIVGGKATLKLKDADVLKTLQAIKAAAAGKTGLTLSLDMGKVNAGSISVPVSKAILEGAKAAGVEFLAVTANNLTLTLPVAQFADSLNLMITKLDDKTVTSISALKLASDVYEFGLEVGGTKVTSFKSPIKVRIPLRDVQVDQELLSVAKVVNGSLQFQGGMLDGKFVVEPRDSFSAYAVVENKVTFGDIAKVQAWAGRQIEVVAAKGAIEGKSAGVFAPQDSVTRAEFAKMLIRALNLENGNDTESFSDVNSSDWYAPYVATAVKLGIIQGRTSETFAPNAQITRAEMATMVSRALKAAKQLGNVDNEGAILSQFSDASKIGSSLKQGVAFAVNHKLVIGNNGKFNPNSSATRAEAAVIIYRTMNYKTN